MVGNININPKVTSDFLDDPPLTTGSSPFKIGVLAAQIPNVYVNGEIYARVSQYPVDQDTPASTSVNANEPFVIDVYWRLNGMLVPALCGNWVFQILFDSMGPSNYDFQIHADHNIPYGCPQPPVNDRHTRTYHARFTVPAGTVQTEPNGTSYELDISLVLLSTCDDLPTGIVGSVPLEDIYFFRS